MRDGGSASTDLSVTATPLAGDSGASIDVGIDHDSSLGAGYVSGCSTSTDAQSAHTSGIYSSADDRSSPISSSSDYDAEMSDGGGVVSVSLDITASGMNTEMDIVNTESIGSENHAAGTPDADLNSDLGADEMDVFPSDPAPNPFQDDPAVAAGPNYLYGFGAGSAAGAVGATAGGSQAHLAHSAAMTEVVQQLQHIQAGQHWGELADVVLPDEPLGHCTDPIPSHPPPSVYGTSFSGGSTIMALYQDDQLSLESETFLLDVSDFHETAVSSQSDDWMAADNVSAVSEINFTDELFINDFADNHEVDDMQNLNLFDFLYSWGMIAARGSTKRKKRGPHLSFLEELRQTTPTEVRREDLNGDRCDLQGIDWTQLEVTRADARESRMATYANYKNLKHPHDWSATLQEAAIVNTENYFKFRHMDFRPKIKSCHFQLRNLLACTSRNSIFYPSGNRVVEANPVYGTRTLQMDLRNPEVQPTYNSNLTGIQISTLTADHNVLIAGGHCGEYAMKAIDQPCTQHVEGLILDDMNSITNHIQVSLNRNSGVPQAAIASNDHGVRVLDCTTNTFVAHHTYSHAINCTAISPDHRLRVLVGDDTTAAIADADTGEILQRLNGHIDYGFACAWADNGWHVATGYQDMLINIWDARKWTSPLHTLSTHKAGARSLRFSPVGGGKRVLVAAEPGDIVNVIDADSYESKQMIDFYGEIMGFDFSPDGQELYVGIHDSLRGGIMEFDKCGFSEVYGRESIYDDIESGNPEDGWYSNMTAGLDWRRTTKDVVKDPRTSRTATYRRRKAAHLDQLDPW